MLASSQDIKKLANKSSLITPFSEERLKNSSYDLSVGDEIYLGKGGDSLLTTTWIPRGHSFTIPAYGIGYILCDEEIKLPHYLSAKVSLRMGLILKGLMLSTQPPFDPNYCGKVILFLHNMSSSPIYLKGGEKVATIEFIYVCNPVKVGVDQKRVESLIQSINSEVNSGLSKLVELNSINEEKQRSFTRWVNIILGLILAIFGGLAGISYTTSKELFVTAHNKTNYENEVKISQLENRIKKLEEKPTSHNSTTIQKEN